MPFISRKDQVHPCHVSPGRHGVSMLLKTFYDKDATAFPENLYLTRILTPIFKGVPWLMAFFPLSSMGMKIRLFPFLSAFMSSHIMSSQSTVFQAKPWWVVWEPWWVGWVGSSKISIIISIRMGAWVYTNMNILMIISTSGVGQHRVIRTSMSPKVLKRADRKWPVKEEFPFFPFIPQSCWSVFGCPQNTGPYLAKKLLMWQIAEKTCNVV